MRKMSALSCLAIFVGMVFAASASAHEIRARADKPAAGRNLAAVLGYGRHFPEGEAIAEVRLPILFPLEVVNLKGEKPPFRLGWPAIRKRLLELWDNSSYNLKNPGIKVFWPKRDQANGGVKTGKAGTGIKEKFSYITEINIVDSTTGQAGRLDRAIGKAGTRRGSRPWSSFRPRP
jgi:hypothetical protein